MDGSGTREEIRKVGKEAAERIGTRGCEARLRLEDNEKG